MGGGDITLRRDGKLCGSRPTPALPIFASHAGSGDSCVVMPAKMERVRAPQGGQQSRRRGHLCMRSRHVPDRARPFAIRRADMSYPYAGDRKGRPYGTSRRNRARFK